MYSSDVITSDDITSDDITSTDSDTILVQLQYPDVTVDPGHDSSYRQVSREVKITRIQIS
ncbi:hypothetical protein DPMN_123716 [Dreissena polymorpha]|uniref:Uncharacterized protein n=1 Tax=Dreissena polymorpha TaxID=45954 RepID=A0A9D4GS46_DREPO|nr:hypothetical protein DPMN_123716 [Dreissena polymorpha]